MKRHINIYLIFLIVFSGCNNSTKKNIKELIEPDNDGYIPLPENVLEPRDNISNPDKVKLGKLLFYDPILSGNKDVSCATCHHPEFGFAEPLDLSIGANGKGLGFTRKFNEPNHIPFVKRNAHTILNTAFNGIDIQGVYHSNESPMFWDNRAKGLEAQALLPIETLEEMRGDKISEHDILNVVVARLKEIPEYVTLFEKAFKRDNAIDKVNLGKAIAAFERTLITPNSRFDKYVQGDENALSMAEKDGFELFKATKCNLCHNGPMFSDYKTHILGVVDNEKLLFSDGGVDSTYAFRTPSLRNLRYTAPYMHNGKLKDLQAVLEFYEDISNGPSKNNHVPTKHIDSLAKQVNIKVMDMSLIISFLNSLNSEDFDKDIPEQVPSGLPVGGDI
ncbi:cytochrome c551 peroxidase [Algibacter lectus]|uniref:Cytochrome c551 peroxidase n=1 Tax=Algibacter lectus TaxID=221126 RepID=A0A090WUG2_9FLAO|nr:cytochrome-c peroxidase [Algibacter lectus]GAL80651.1 cytochrome c551 peroxidase [Algibacter lectus]